MFVGLNLGVPRKCARKVFAVKLDCSKQTNKSTPINHFARLSEGQEHPIRSAMRSEMRLCTKMAVSRFMPVGTAAME